MNGIAQGATPTITFRTPFAADQIDKCRIIFSQKVSEFSDEEIVVLRKYLDDCTINGNTIALTLSEKETLLLDSKFPVEIQVRCAAGSERMVSKVIETEVYRILDGGPL